MLRPETDGAKVEPLQENNAMAGKSTKKSWAENLIEPTAIIIRCYDRRFRVAHNGFIKEVLKLDGNDFWPIKGAGGAGPLARPDEMAFDHGKLVQDLATAMSPKIRHVVLFTHEDCHRYKEIRETFGDYPEARDAAKAADFVAAKYPRIEVAAIYAHFTNDTPRQIRFKVVRESSLINQDEIDYSCLFS
jgi:hypothetical protein